MRKGRDGGKKKREKREKKKTGKKKEKRRMKIVATTSLPAVDRPNADRWNAARLRQKGSSGVPPWSKLINFLRHISAIIQYSLSVKAYFVYISFVIQLYIKIL